MKTVDDYERIRKAYYVEGLSIREINRQHAPRAQVDPQSDRSCPTRRIHVEGTADSTGPGTLQTEN